MGRIKQFWIDYSSAILIYGFLRGNLRYFYGNKLDNESRNPFIIRLILRYDSLFKFLIKRLASKGMENRFPEKVYTESTNACNARCIMCNREHMKRKVGTMSMPLFKNIASQSSALGIREIRFHNFGEPMIDSNLAAKVAYAKKIGIQSTVMYSNGSLLSEQLAKNLIDSGLDQLYVSFDGGSKATYEKIRVGLDFDEVSRNIGRMMSIRRRKKLHKPYLELVLLPVDNDVNDVELFQKKWNGVVDSVRISALHDFAGQQESIKNKGNNSIQIPCYMLWKSLFVLWNGDVSLCCMDFDGKYILGNVEEHSLEEVWRSDKFNEVRLQHVKGDLSRLSLCQNCHVNHVSEVSQKLEALRLWIN